MDENKGWARIAGEYTAADLMVLREAARVDPAFGKRIGIDRMATGAPADFLVEDFRIGDIAVNPKPGDDVFIDVYGKVTDLNAGPISNWQVVVAVAAVDFGGNPTALRTFLQMPSSWAGMTPFGRTIKISENFPLSNKYHAVIGKMGASTLSVWAELFANHDSSAPWDWSLWLSYPE